MKAMIFAAGLGTRLKPLTDTMPKALIEVGGVPVLQRALDRISEVGIKDIVINVHHFSHQVMKFVANLPTTSELNIMISDESDLLLDTGGGLLNAHSLLGDDDPILLYNADIVTDLPLSEMISKYNADLPLATLLVANRNSSRRLLFDGAMRMRGWLNLSSGETKPAGINAEAFDALAFGGIHIVSPWIFPLLKKYSSATGPKFSITPFYIDHCNDYCIKGYMPCSEYRWHDIGSLEKLQSARQEFS